jgi:hypothetical protein
MGKLAYAGGINPRIRRLAVEILQGNNVPERDVPAMAAALFDFVQSTYYVWDPWDAEWLQKVGIQLDDIAAGREGLDCDDKSILLASLGRSVGLPVNFKAISGQAASRGNFDHVYALIGDPRTGEWVAADPTQPHPLGWEPPAYVKWWVFDPAEGKVVAAGGPQGPPPTPPRGGLARRRPPRPSYLAPQLSGLGATGFGALGQAPDGPPPALTDEEMQSGGMRWWTDPRDSTKYLTSNQGITDEQYRAGARTMHDPYTREVIGEFNVGEVESAHRESIRGPRPVIPEPCDATAAQAAKMPDTFRSWMAAFYKWADPDRVYEASRGHQQGVAFDSVMGGSYDPFRYHSLVDARRARQAELDKTVIGGWQRKVNDYLRPTAYMDRTDENKALVSEFFDWRQDCYGKREAWVAHPARARELLLQEHGLLTSYQRELDNMIAEALTYVDPVLAKIRVLEKQADYHVERLEDRAEFLKLVNDIAGVTGAVLSALGPVTAGITEVLAIAVAVGNLAYQSKQIGAMYTSSSAKSLQAIGSGILQLADILAWVENIAEQANAEWYVAQDLKVAIMDALPAATPPVVTAPVAAPPLEATVAPRKKGGAGLLAAAAGLALMLTGGLG